MDTGNADLTTIVATVVSMVTLALGFSLLALNVSSFWVVFPIGFGAVLPIAMNVAEDYEERNGEDSKESEEESNRKENALEELKRKFVDDEISEEEFERRVEKLVGTETVKDAKEYVERSGDETTSEKIDKRAEFEKETD